MQYSLEPEDQLAVVRDVRVSLAQLHRCSITIIISLPITTVRWGTQFVHCAVATNLVNEPESQALHIDF